MIRLNNINVSLDFDFSKENIIRLCANELKLKSGDIKSAVLSKKSVDARKKDKICFVISVDIELQKTLNEKKIPAHNKNAVQTEKYTYHINHITPPEKRPVIIGFGPAGMFASLVLAESGANPIVLERGSDVDSRKKAVEDFWNTGILDENCNVQFGEGGAGTFSDGKLTTGTKDPRIRYILESFVKFDAPEEILYLAKPHIGTDKLVDVVKNLRNYVISKGGEVRFNSLFNKFEIENGKIKGVYFNDNQYIETDSVILATGHSARDTFEMLYENNIELSQKNFAVGVRIEHLRKDIDKALYGKFAGHHALKSADYKLVSHLSGGRNLYTFCMCPGGYVVNASSEKNRIAINGMSLYARSAENSNSALLTGISPSDLQSSHPLAGMYFQRDIEHKAFVAGGENYRVPVCLYGDFIKGIKSGKTGRITPSCKPFYKFALPDEYLPKFICETLKDGIREMGKKIKGFDCSDAVITGVESRSSSPVRINRDESFQSVSVRGLYPCGEGAGYAGGIVSAGVDGVKCAEAVLKNFKENMK